MQNLTLAETFSGIGGWNEAARMAGDITPIWHCENDPNKIKYYEHRHPNVPNLGDIRNIQSAPYADILTVSFPCTGFSTAGKGEGFENEGSKLWFEGERLIRIVRPRYIVIENSPTLNRGGLVRILGSLANLGYDAEWATLHGGQFGIQQLRKRLYCVAYARENGQQSKYPKVGVFRRITPSIKDAALVYPGWRERRDIPQPRTVRSAYDIPGLLHRLAGIGDAIIPLIGCYILTCIKLHAEQ